MCSRRRSQRMELEEQWRWAEGMKDEDEDAWPWAVHGDFEAGDEEPEEGITVYRCAPRRCCGLQAV